MTAYPCPYTLAVVSGGLKRLLLAAARGPASPRARARLYPRLFPVLLCALVALPTLCGCGMVPSSGEVAALRADLARHGEELEEAEKRARARGDELSARVHASKREVLEEFEGRAEALERGLEAAGESALSLGEGGAVAAVTTLLGALGLNAQRNRSRRREQELLFTPAPSQRASP